MFYGFGLLKFVDNSFIAYMMTLGMWINLVGAGVLGEEGCGS